VQALRAFERDGLVALQPDRICITAKGRSLVRRICMLFDRYLQGELSATRYSRTI
jgi:oxygen-independent coproporphyrinogen-3 oxidase